VGRSGKNLKQNDATIENRVTKGFLGNGTLIKATMMSRFRTMWIGGWWLDEEERKKAPGFAPIESTIKTLCGRGTHKESHTQGSWSMRESPLGKKKIRGTLRGQKTKSKSCRLDGLLHGGASRNMVTKKNRAQNPWQNKKTRMVIGVSKEKGKQGRGCRRTGRVRPKTTCKIRGKS